MPSFPKLKTGAVAQYPATRELRFATRALRFVDGAEQRFRLRAAGRRRWEIRLAALDEPEMAEIERFFEQSQGALGSFSFTDPWSGTEYPNCSLESDRVEVQALGEMRGQTTLVVRENAI